MLYSEMLLDGLAESEETRNEFLTTIVENCKRLTRLINNVLDISKIEAGRMQFNYDALNIKDLVDEIFKSFKPVIDRKRINLKCNLVDGGIRLRGDRDRIIQVLTNIISNAVKFTPPDGTVSISQTSNEEVGTIAVRDSVEGIKQEDIPKVFDRFSQLENINHHSEGTGLGMTISKSIIEHHGGDIWFESEAGLGTTVYFSLPVTKLFSEPEEQPDKKAIYMMKSNKQQNGEHILNRILIVDDEASFRTALKGCIEHAGYLTIEASGGKEALRMIKEHYPVLIILDVMMPDVSGLEVCRSIRNNPKTSRIKVIILSAKGQEKEKEEGLKAGADEYITKPFDYKELIKKIKLLMDS
ncbi:MAG TPA: response regulator [bacterium]|nr:response regulator [bacterium]